MTDRYKFGQTRTIWIKMGAAITTLGGFVSLLGMSFVNDMHIMECVQFLFFISISSLVSQKATDHTYCKLLWVFSTASGK